MKVKNRRITVSVSKTFNLGNYESLKVSAELSADIQNTEDLNDAYSVLFDQCVGQIIANKNKVQGELDEA